MVKVLRDDDFWDLVDKFEVGDQTPERACELILDAYRKRKKAYMAYYEEACSDVELMLHEIDCQFVRDYFKKVFRK